MTNSIVGIVGTGIYLPNQVRTAGEIAKATGGVWTEEAVTQKLGIKQIYVANQSEGPQEMSYLAALDCLQNTGVDPMSIDVILSVTEEWKEYPLTTSALYVQGKLGASNAWGIDLQNRCCTTVSAIKIAKDMLIADDEIDTILIVGGYRNGDFVDYEDKTMSMMYNLSAGAGAMILQKGYAKNEVLGSHIIGDGTLARTAGVVYGGTCNPITKDNVDRAYKSLTLMEPVKMKERLNEVSMSKDIDYLEILHIKRSGHEAMLEELGLSEDQSIYLEHYGHIGQIDQILSLHLGLQSGKIQNGDNVCLLAAGIGYVWAASIVRWGE